MAFPKIGPTIPGLGVDYVSPAVSVPRQNAINIRSTGATTGEAARFARLAPKGTTTKPAKPISVAQALRNTGATTGEATRFAALAPSGTTVTSTGEVVVPDRPVVPPAPEELVIDPGASSDSGTGDSGIGDGGGGGGGSTESAPAPAPAPAPPPVEEAPAGSDIDVQALYDSILAGLLEPDFIGFQGSQASELRRLQNLRNQLFGDAEFGTTGSIQRQRDLDARARRRLAAQRAVAGMLQGGAYAGPQRGVGTIQQAEQEYGVQEMLRPFREQTMADRLREFGLGYAPDNRAFDLLDFGNEEDIMGGWASQTFAGRQARARARQAALEQLTQRGLSL